MKTIKTHFKIIDRLNYIMVSHTIGMGADKVTNENLTNELALRYIRGNKLRIQFFSEYPENWEKLVSGEEQLPEITDDFQNDTITTTQNQEKEDIGMPTPNNALCSTCNSRLDTKIGNKAIKVDKLYYISNPVTPLWVDKQSPHIDISKKTKLLVSLRDMEKIYIKNMVCPRCITAVAGVINAMGISPIAVKLGEVTLAKELTPSQIELLAKRLEQAGFELLTDNKLQLAEKIKAIIVNHIHHNSGAHIVFSEVLASELHKEYSQLSKLFSATQGITIEQFIILQKTEKVKELLLYNQLNLSEIANSMGYSSVAHLSAQFKKTTGYTPTQFRLQGNSLRKPLDDVTKKL